VMLYRLGWVRCGGIFNEVYIPGGCPDNTVLGSSPYAPCFTSLL